jgi:hypothetical protein
MDPNSAPRRDVEGLQSKPKPFNVASTTRRQRAVEKIDDGAMSTASRGQVVNLIGKGFPVSCVANLMTHVDPQDIAMLHTPQCNLQLAVIFKTKDGKKVQVELLFSAQVSRTRIREIMMVFTFALTGVPAEEYIVDITLRDVVSGKSGVLSPSGDYTLDAGMRPAK